MAGPDKDFPTEEEAQENQAKDIKIMKAWMWNALFFFAGVLSGGWIIALGMAMAGTFTDDYFILPLK